MDKHSICKKCGSTHGMVIEEMTTGKTEPMDLCKNCFCYGSYKPITEKIVLTNKQ